MIFEVGIKKVNCHSICRFYDTHLGQYISLLLRKRTSRDFQRKNEHLVGSIELILSQGNLYPPINFTRLFDLNNCSGRLFFSLKPQVFCSEAFSSFSEANMFRRFRKAFDCLRAFGNHKLLFKNFNQKLLFKKIRDITSGGNVYHVNEMQAVSLIN